MHYPETPTTSEYFMYAKTGAATENWQGQEWYVGYLYVPSQLKEKVWFFATHIDILNRETLKKRQAITLDVLKRKHII